LTRQANQHLTQDEIDVLFSSGAAGDLQTASLGKDAGEAELHLAECEQCRRLLTKYVAAERALGGLKSYPEMGRGADCPPDEQWYSMAAGLVTSSQGDILAQHAATCDHCGPTLRMAMEDFADNTRSEEAALIGELDKPENEWRQALPHRLSVASRRGVSRGLKSPLRAFWASNFWPRIAFCTALILLAGLALWHVRETPLKNGEKLITKAYTEQRTLELRLPNAPHAPVRAERGITASRLKRPTSLLDAEALVSRYLAHHLSDPAWLEIKGQTELLEWDSDDAIKSFHDALELDPASVPLKVDLASAYFERAESTDRPLDYGTAAEWLGRALAQRPNDAVVLFNRAIVYEQLHMYGEAERDWEHYLTVDPNGDWSGEAQTRLNALRQKMKNRGETEPSSYNAASAFLNRFSGSNQISNDGSDSPEEAYLQSAITVWLPLIQDPHSNASSRDSTFKALNLLNSLLRSRHQDQWLSHLLATSPSVSSRRGMSLLAKAVDANVRGDSDRAIALSIRAEPFFRRTRNQAGELRSRFEILYALKRSQRGHECSVYANRLISDLDGYSYAWIRIQTLLEQANCRYMVGDLDEAIAIAETAQREAKIASYGTLYLRALGFEAGLQSAKGNMDYAWRLDCDGLTRYWSGEYDSLRAWQFYSDMGFAAEGSSDWHLATALAREAVTAAASARRLGEEAAARFRLATDASAASQDEEAKKEFENGEQIYAQLPQSGSARAFETVGEIGLAELDLQKGRVDDVAAHLTKVSANLAQIQSYTIPLRYYKTLGKLRLLRGEDDAAEAALRAAVFIADLGGKNLLDEADRWTWRRATSDVYRSLIELLLLRRKDPQTALRLWESYRSSVLAEGRNFSSPIPARASSQLQEIPAGVLDQGPPLPKNDFDLLLPSLRQVTIVSYAWLGDGLETWTYNNNGIHSFWQPLSQEAFGHVARRFAENCANPQSSLANIEADGRQLYAWLFSTIESLLTDGRLIVVEPDGLIGLIPMQALRQPSGQYLAERWNLQFSPGIGYRRPVSALQPKLLMQAQALIVGVPGVRGSMADDLPALADAHLEVEAIAKEFTRKTVLLGNDATQQAVLDKLRDAVVFHFAGHALASVQRTGILLPAMSSSGGQTTPGVDLVDATRIRRVPLRRCQLVVLSACSTAKPEEAIMDPEDLVSAFLAAGASNVIASRWDVNSVVTRSLMEAFYSHLSRNDAVPTALQEAEAETRKQSATSHPYYWAGFASFGSS
jgi:CHAT domain-containing protein